MAGLMSATPQGSDGSMVVWEGVALCADHDVMHERSRVA